MTEAQKTELQTIVSRNLTAAYEGDYHEVLTEPVEDIAGEMLAYADEIMDWASHQVKAGCDYTDYVTIADLVPMITVWRKEKQS